MTRSRSGGAGRSVALVRYALTALLRLPDRRAPEAPSARVRRDPAASSFEAPAAATNALQFSRAYWLPPLGRGNGLEALFWTPLRALPEGRVDDVLRALGEAEIPGWAAPTRGPGGAGTDVDHPHDLWVASATSNRAEDVVIRVLANHPAA